MDVLIIVFTLVRLTRVCQYPFASGLYEVGPAVIETALSMCFMLQVSESLPEKSD